MNFCMWYWNGILGIDHLREPNFTSLERVQETGQRLAKFPKLCGVPFEYIAIAKEWENITLYQLHLREGEVLTINWFLDFNTFQIIKLYQQTLDYLYSKWFEPWIQRYANYHYMITSKWLLQIFDIGLLVILYPMSFTPIVNMWIMLLFYLVSTSPWFILQMKLW